MHKFEIFERRYPNAVISTVEHPDMRSFRNYWRQQCTAELDYREIDAPAAPAVQYRVIKDADGHNARHDEQEFLPLTDQLLAEIAKQNGMLTAAEVHKALVDGKAIFTRVNRYRLE